MLLAEALQNHRAALLASFRAEYQLPIVGHGLSLTEFAAMVAWLPPGCAFWRSVGGPLSWSEETHLLNLVEFRVRALFWQQTENGRKGTNQPEPTKPPKYSYEAEAEAVKEDARAAAWRRRQRGSSSSE